LRGDNTSKEGKKFLDFFSKLYVPATPNTWFYMFHNIVYFTFFAEEYMG
jgi:hypothetical protein